MKTNRDRTLPGTGLPFYSDTSPLYRPPQACQLLTTISVNGEPVMLRVFFFFHLGMRSGGINYNSSSSMRKHQLLFIFKEAKMILISFLCLKVSFCPSHTRFSGCSSDGGSGVLTSVGMESHLFFCVSFSSVFSVRAVALITKRISSTTRYWSM